MKLLKVCLTASILLILFPPAQAQSPNTVFQPGEWQIESTVTPSVGNPVHRQVSICAQSAGQTWQSGTANQSCTAPTVTAIAGGYNIKLNCTGGAGPVQWKSASSIRETFSNGGRTFDASGTTTTTVSYAGHAPMTSSAALHAMGKRTGACK
jgi:hypothetical protein